MRRLGAEGSGAAVTDEVVTEVSEALRGWRGGPTPGRRNVSACSVCRGHRRQNGTGELAHGWHLSGDCLLAVSAVRVAGHRHYIAVWMGGFRWGPNWRH